MKGARFRDCELSIETLMAVLFHGWEFEKRAIERQSRISRMFNIKHKSAAFKYGSEIARMLGVAEGFEDAKKSFIRQIKGRFQLDCNPETASLADVMNELDDKRVGGLSQYELKALKLASELLQSVMADYWWRGQAPEGLKERAEELNLLAGKGKDNG